jgi:hypothetical protein
MCQLVTDGIRGPAFLKNCLGGWRRACDRARCQLEVMNKFVKNLHADPILRGAGMANGGCGNFVKNLHTDPILGGSRGRDWRAGAYLAFFLVPFAEGFSGAGGSAGVSLNLRTVGSLGAGPSQR